MHAAAAECQVLTLAAVASGPRVRRVGWRIANRAAQSLPPKIDGGSELQLRAQAVVCWGWAAFLIACQTSLCAAPLGSAALHERASRHAQAGQARAANGEFEAARREFQAQLTLLQKLVEWGVADPANMEEFKADPEAVIRRLFRHNGGE